jgi:hypothetical protein
VKTGHLIAGSASGHRNEGKSGMETVHGYDVIGDIHGQAGKLRRMLAHMGYVEIAGVWRHPTRTAVYVGDFVDRGPEQVETYRIVRAMTDAGTALAVMGNHEFNAIAFHTPCAGRDFCRTRSPRNVAQHRSFLDQVGMDGDLHREMVDWFLDLPLWLDLDGIRVVHACWDDAIMARLAPMLRPGNRLDRDLVARASEGQGNSFLADGSRRDSTFEFHAVETLLKGVEIELPEGTSYSDADGHARTATRVRWWDGGARTFGEAALLPGSTPTHGLEAPLPADFVRGYDGEKPLFLGHYWMTDEPTLLGPKVACVDYSAGKGGPLAAYRWSGETTLSPDGFTSVD